VEASIVSSLGELVACRRRGSADVGRSTGGSLVGVLGKLVAVLAGKSDKLVALRALRNWNTIVVAPFLDLAIGPRVEECVGESVSGGGSGCGSRGGGIRHAAASIARVATDRSDQLVTAAGLGSWDAALIEPSLEIRFGPGLVKPVARIANTLTSLIGSALVVFANGAEERIPSAWVRVGNAVLVEERLEL